MSNGFTWHDRTVSKKLGIQTHRIKIKDSKKVYSIHPNYVMPYMTAFAKDIETALFLYRFGVPYWALTYAFKKNDMFWYRLFSGFGRCSIVGSTVKDSCKMPLNLAADEKQTYICGKKIYGAMTVGDNCILGAALCSAANAQSLTEAYKIFKNEAKNVNPAYQPKSVNIDGWIATQITWQKLFPKINLILCFLHSYLRVKNICKYSTVFASISSFIWSIYHATNKKDFVQKTNELKIWAGKNIKQEVMLKTIYAMCSKVNFFTKSYDHTDARRTSNMVDRLMRWADKYLFNMQYFHGSMVSANKGFVAWAILRNNQPYCSRVNRDRNDLLCAASDLNGFKYSEDWLENLLASISMNGYRQ